jgi:hypothetical protein
VGGKENSSYVTDLVDRQTIGTSLFWPMGLKDIRLVLVAACTLSSPLACIALHVC